MRWLSLGEYCCNTMHHMLTSMTPFRALYNYDTLSFVDLALGDSKVIKEYLVQWKDLPLEDATWEGEMILQHLAL